ncbi:MAG: hypothetical protein V5B30_06960 [Candidatus Accumulibacter delftensis]|jgi:hypothetical protein
MNFLLPGRRTTGTGALACRLSDPVVSMHFDGHTMNDVNTYELATRARRQGVVAHKES